MEARAVIVRRERWIAAAVAMVLIALLAVSIGLVRALQPGGDQFSSWLVAATVFALGSSLAALRSAVPHAQHTPE